MLILRRLLKDQDGATAIEYGLIGVLLSIAIVAGVTQVGSAIGTTYNNIATQALGNGTLANP
ncbi:Flp family type IVb pilin [Rhizobium sp. C4]|uniref:Flp family type IVb pilin n=1 Tax=Rhizobium sp. C4 TaxID=1349800 RepID=UPI001E584431|nr:Flp family type IVb pilin [Rhizobium sp. C4]MCD2175730.1 Flp family type IVb pilin [Rhizobium sp. C4]